MRSKKIAWIAVVVCIVAGLGWVGIRQLGKRGDASDAVGRAEQALSTPGLIALARVDVPELRELLQKAEGAAEQAPLDFDGELLEPLGLRGVALARDVSTALIAVSSDDEARVSAVLFGTFDPAALESAIRAIEPELRAVDEAGDRTLYLSRLDADLCTETVWGIALRAGRVVIRNEAALEPLLAQLGDPDPPQSGWRARLAKRPLATLRFAPTAKLAPSRTQPLGRALLRGAQRSFPGVERVELRIERTALRSGVKIQMDLHGRDAAAATALISSWEQSRSAGEDWTQIAPALAAWFTALRLESDGAYVHARAERGAEASRELREIPATLVLAASRDLGAETDAAKTDQIEAWPTLFLERFALAKLPPYGAGRATSDPVDAVVGPFGLRLERAARASADDPVELTLRAFGPLIPNLPADAAAWVAVERALGAEGQPLLREERCGRDRNAHPARLRRESIVERSEAEKKIRLAPDAGLRDVDRIEGRIELDLPERTQTVRVREPRAGQVLEASGGSVEITSVTGTSLSYRVRGEPRLIHIRGLNADRASLASVEAWEADLPFGEGRLGARRFAGALASVEAIFALEVRHASYPFALGSARPGSDGASLDVESSEFIHYSPEQYRKEFGAFKGFPFPVDRTPLGAASAGPFTVGVTGRASAPSLAPTLTVLAPPGAQPDIPRDRSRALGERDRDRGGPAAASEAGSRADPGRPPLRTRLPRGRRVLRHRRAAARPAASRERRARAPAAGRGGERELRRGRAGRCARARRRRLHAHRAPARRLHAAHVRPARALLLRAGFRRGRPRALGRGARDPARVQSARAPLPRARPAAQDRDPAGARLHDAALRVPHPDGRGDGGRGADPTLIRTEATRRADEGGGAGYCRMTPAHDWLSRTLNVLPWLVLLALRVSGAIALVFFPGGHPRSSSSCSATGCWRCPAVFPLGMARFAYLLLRRGPPPELKQLSVPSELRDAMFGNLALVITTPAVWLVLR